MSQNTQRAAVALRYTIVSAVTGIPGDSLDQLNTAKMPDGALVFAVNRAALYYLDKSSTATANSSVGAVVAPLGGPGRFIYLNGATNPFAAQFTSTGSLTGTTAETANTWIALPAGTNFYQSGPDGDFTLNTTTGIATYNGPTQRFRVTSSISIASAVVAQQVEVALSVGGGFIGTSTTIPSAGSASVPPTTVNLPIQITSNVILSLANADTLQVIVRDDTASNNITVSRMNTVVTPA